MGEVRAELVKMTEKLTASRHSANLIHNIHPTSVNCPVSRKKVGTKNLD
jgi:hypothetical protein